MNLPHVTSVVCKQPWPLIIALFLFSCFSKGQNILMVACLGGLYSLGLEINLS